VVGGVLMLALRPVSPPIAAHPAGARTAGPRLSRELLRPLRSLPAPVWMATLIALYINLAIETYFNFYPLYALSIGISLAAISTIKSAHSLAATGVRFGAVWLLHLFKMDLLNHGLVLVTALCLAALSVATNEPVLMVLFVILGSARALLRVTSVTIVAELKPRAGLKLGFASSVYNAGYDLGSMLASPIAGAIAGLTDVPTTLRLLAVALPSLYYAVWFATRGRRQVAESEARA
jgi:hypothetical protein